MVHGHVVYKVLGMVYFQLQETLDYVLFHFVLIPIFHPLQWIDPYIRYISD